MKLFTFFFAQILGLPKVFAGCYHDNFTRFDKCYFYSYNLFSYTLGTGAIIGIIIGGPRWIGNVDWIHRLFVLYSMQKVHSKPGCNYLQPQHNYGNYDSKPISNTT
ncbi:uncharacterized protein LOC134239762 [Saccostrea cucullata]|uniref:uncharacterized protein LOC134239762 n=1 Tax=Saccostrea cuccullata TaxID=36930 RepID=UPI002ED6B4C5